MIVGLPKALKQTLAGYHWQRVTLGRSGAAVYRLSRGDVLYLKRACGEEALAGEVARLRWLRAKLTVPEVLEYTQEQGFAYLLMSEVAGKDASHKAHATKLEGLVALLAKGMQALHTLSAHSPFDHSLDAELSSLRLKLGQGPNAQAALAKLEALENRRPDEAPLVFTHGDYCLPNILVQGRSFGFVDLGQAGLSDPYRDLERAAWSLAYNWGERWVPALFEAYGVVPDQEKLAFYRELEWLR